MLSIFGGDSVLKIRVNLQYITCGCAFIKGKKYVQNLGHAQDFQICSMSIFTSVITLRSVKGKIYSKIHM